MTIKEKTEKARKILAKYLDNNYLSKDDTGEFSKLVGEDLEEVFKGIHPVYNSQNHLTVVKRDGSRVAGYGWRDRISGKNTKSVSDIKSIMRKSVSCQTRYIMSFLSMTKTASSCYFCGKKEELVVDHVFPPFDEIAESWIEENGFPELKKCEERQNTWFASKNQEESWQRFHWSKSFLLLLCRSCNGRKSKSKTQFMWIMAAMLELADGISILETDLMKICDNSDMFSKEYIKSLFLFTESISKVTFKTKDVIPEEFIHDWHEQ